MTVDARLDVNVALRRPSFQPSVYSDSDGTYPPAYANDGGKGTNLSNGPCAHTNHETNPWWVVDLGVRLYVHGVKFTSRDIFGMCAVSF